MKFAGLKVVLVATGLASAIAGAAAEEPRFCPTRPSLGGSSCTTEPGQLHFELSGVDWERDDQPGQRDDRIIAGDFLARLGVGKDTELQLGWTGFGSDRSRDKLTGKIDRITGTGDLVFAVREHLAGREGRPFSAGAQAFLTAPTGRYPIGAGTWSAGMIVPVQYNLTEKLAVAFTGEADAASNGSGDGRHLAYSGIGGIRYKLTGTVSTSAEMVIERDNDPSEHVTRALTALSIAWRPAKKLQLDVLCVAGLNHSSPDLRVVTGGAILF